VQVFVTPLLRASWQLEGVDAKNKQREERGEENRREQEEASHRRAVTGSSAPVSTTGACAVGSGRGGGAGREFEDDGDEEEEDGIQRRGKVTVVPNYSLTPLHLALARGHIDVVKFLWPKVKEQERGCDYVSTVGHYKLLIGL
jgi:hypothetical protein